MFLNARNADMHYILCDSNAQGFVRGKHYPRYEETGDEAHSLARIRILSLPSFKSKNIMQYFITAMGYTILIYSQALRHIGSQEPREN